MQRGIQILSPKAPQLGQNLCTMNTDHQQDILVYPWNSKFM